MESRYYMLKRFAAMVTRHQAEAEAVARALAKRLDATAPQARRLNVDLDTIVLAFRAARFFEREGERALASRFGELARRADLRDVDEQSFLATLVEIRDEIRALQQEFASLPPPTRPQA